MIPTKSFVEGALKEFFSKNSRPIDSHDLHDFHREEVGSEVSGDRVLREDDLIVLSSFLARKIMLEYAEEASHSASAQNMLATKINLNALPIVKAEALSSMFSMMSQMMISSEV